MAHPTPCEQTAWLSFQGDDWSPRKKDAEQNNLMEGGGCSSWCKHSISNPGSPANHFQGPHQYSPWDGKGVQGLSSLYPTALQGWPTVPLQVSPRTVTWNPWQTAQVWCQDSLRPSAEPCWCSEVQSGIQGIRPSWLVWARWLQNPQAPFIFSLQSLHCV